MKYLSEHSNTIQSTSFGVVDQDICIYIELTRLIHNNYFSQKHGTYYIFIKN